MLGTLEEAGRRARGALALQGRSVFAANRAAREVDRAFAWAWSRFQKTLDPRELGPHLVAALRVAIGDELEATARDSDASTVSNLRRTVPLALLVAIRAKAQARRFFAQEDASGLSFDGLEAALFKPLTKAQALDLVNEPFKGKTWTQRLGAATLNANDLASEIANGLSLGKSNAEIAKAILPMVQGSKARALMIARTEAHRVNVTAQMRATTRALGDAIAGWVYTATLDNRTRPEHAALDGTYYPKGEPKPLLPSDPNCRCVYTPKMKDYDDLGLPPEIAKALNDDAENGGGRAATLWNKATGELEGQAVAKGTTYATWFNAQSADVKRDILGDELFDKLAKAKGSVRWNAALDAYGLGKKKPSPPDDGAAPPQDGPAPPPLPPLPPLPPATPAIADPNAPRDSDGAPRKLDFEPPPLPPATPEPAEPDLLDALLAPTKPGLTTADVNKAWKQMHDAGFFVFNQDGGTVVKDATGKEIKVFPAGANSGEEIAAWVLRKPLLAPPPQPKFEPSFFLAPQVPFEVKIIAKNLKQLGYSTTVDYDGNIEVHNADGIVFKAPFGAGSHDAFTAFYDAKVSTPPSAFDQKAPTIPAPPPVSDADKAKARTALSLGGFNVVNWKSGNITVEDPFGTVAAQFDGPDAKAHLAKWALALPPPAPPPPQHGPEPIMPAAAKLAKPGTPPKQKAATLPDNEPTTPGPETPLAAPSALSTVNDEILDATGFKRLKPSTGSNPGFFARDPADGTEWLVKQPKSEEIGGNEFLANRLYAELGVAVPDLRRATVDGKTALASRIVPDLDFGGQSWEQSVKRKVYEDFATDALLGNWDVVGQGYDNIALGKDGRPLRLDTGGALLFRAQGSPKGTKFGNDVEELNTLRDPSTNQQAAAMFAGMTKNDVLASINKLKTRFDVQRIAAAVDRYGGHMQPAAREELKAKLAARFDSIVQKGLKLEASIQLAQNEQAIVAQTLAKPKALPPAAAVAKQIPKAQVAPPHTADKTWTHGPASVTTDDIRKGKRTPLFDEWHNTLDKHEKTALAHYTGGGFTEVRHHLLDDARAQNMTPEKRKQLQGRVDALLGAMQRAPKVGGALWRGMRFDTAEQMQGFIGSLGSESFTLKSVTSSSVQRERAENFSQSSKNQLTASGFLLHLKTRTGVWVAPYSEHPTENEALLAPGTRFRFLGMHHDGKYLIVEAEEVEQSPIYDQADRIIAGEPEPVQLTARPGGTYGGYTGPA